MPYPAGYREHIGPWMAKREILRDLQVPDDEIVVLDIGAYKGDVTAMYMRMWPNAQYYLFEPEPVAVKGLIDRFQGKENVTLVPMAVGAEDSEGETFYVGGQGTEMSSLLRRPTEDESRRYFRHDRFEEIEVPVITLDTFVREAELDHIDVVKVDVQGAEGAVLEGAKYVLRYKKPKVWYMEVLFVEMYKNATSFLGIANIMARYHYTIFDLYNMGRSPVNRQLKYADALFVSDEVREESLDNYPEEWLPKSLEHAMGMRR